MMSPGGDEVLLDCVIYLGDPDDGSGPVSLGDLTARRDELAGQANLENGLYGSIGLKRGDARIMEAPPDPILKLLTSMVRTIPYVIEGEPETALFNESEHGVLFEPASDKVQVSFFRGDDAYEPDEYLSEVVTMSLDQFAGELIGIADKVVDFCKTAAPEQYDSDEFAADLIELLEVAKSAYKSYRLESERGLRR